MTGNKIISYEKPTGKSEWWWYNATDNNGKAFWLDWREWMRGGIKIKKDDDIKLLPKEIADYMPKWQKELNKIVTVENWQYPLKLVEIRFIYNDVIYSLYPDAFCNDGILEKMRGFHQDYFDMFHDIVENDLKEIGCIYSHYFGELD